MEDINTRSTWKLLLWFGLVTLGVLLIIPYIQTEIRTNSFSDEFPLDEFCPSENRRMFKVLNFNKQKGEFDILCLYYSNQESIRARGNYVESTDTWVLIRREQLNEENSFIWPLYV